MGRSLTVDLVFLRQRRQEPVGVNQRNHDGLVLGRGHPPSALPRARKRLLQAQAGQLGPGPGPGRAGGGGGLQKLPRPRLMALGQFSQPEGGQQIGIAGAALVGGDEGPMSRLGFALHAQRFADDPAGLPVGGTVKPEGGKRLGFFVRAENPVNPIRRKAGVVPEPAGEFRVARVEITPKKRLIGGAGF